MNPADGQTRPTHPDRAPASAVTIINSSAPPAAPALEPGQTIADRYRIVALLGKGGMGEVYRADDLTLGVSVALKFLPQTVSDDAARLAHFKSEVRLTRQISHPNVCRVYDIAQSGGRTFLAMEFIDGEDLASLLRRIGRIPQEKAVEIARQACAGLAAAHDLGVIHRDLKPANIMLDGRGQARIADFGVAGIAEDLASRSDIRAGTPAYMAPEQLEGRAVSKRSDIYSLGLVLYELFTGKPAHSANSIAELRELHQSSTQPTNPSDLVAGLDPAVERVILRCLSTDPAMRPASAIAVAAALPGGDPIAAALAAGETPSPEMIARSGGDGILSGRAAAGTLAVCALALVALILGGSRYLITSIAPLELSPAVLAAKARDHAAALGIPKSPMQEAWAFSADTQYLSNVTKSDESAERWLKLSNGSARGLTFWYRASPRPLDPRMWWRPIPSRDDPPFETPGELQVLLDSQGRLIRFYRLPPEGGFSPGEDERAGEVSAAQWGAAFHAAGLILADFQPAAPERAPVVGADRRYAWIGVYPDNPATPLRVEASSLDSVPVEFRLVPPWREAGTQAQPDKPAQVVVRSLVNLALAGGLVAAALLTRRNIRAGRSDRRGAARLSLVLFSLEMLRLLLPHHSLAALIRADLIGRPAARALWAAGVAWLAYMALEPYVRRIWPRALIAWSRVLAGEWRDARVARDVLFGLAGGLAVAAAVYAPTLFSELLSDAPPRPIIPDTTALLGPGFVLSRLANTIVGAAALSLLLLLALVGLRHLLTRPALVYPIFAVVSMLLYSVDSDTDAASLAILGVVSLLGTVLLVRVGLLAHTVYLAAYFFLALFPFSTDLSAWHGTTGWLVAAAVAIIAGVCARGATRAGG